MRQVAALGLVAMVCAGCNAMTPQKRASLYQSEIDRLSAEKAILERELREERIRRERAEAIVLADRADRMLPPDETSGTVSVEAPAAPAKPVSAKPQSVKEIQMALANAGYEPGPIDGKMGSKTREAVRRFQKDAGLKADGVVGPVTWSKLGQFSSAEAK